jgi:isoleucyl-tRNA synthetase
VRNKAPFKTLITHGFLLDEKGHKMSKSLGNVLDPQSIVPAYGVDVLRTWVASSDYTNDIYVGKTVLGNVRESVRKFRNTARFMLGNLYNLELPLLPLQEMTNLDRYMLHELALFLGRTRDHYKLHAFNKVYQDVAHFTNADLSAFYFDVIKDRLYAYRPQHPLRKSAQAVLLYVVHAYMAVLAPFATHLAQEIYEHMPSACRDALHMDRQSILAHGWPVAACHFLLIEWL